MKTDQKALFEKIGKEIHSDSSPVGIDAKKTHILILAKLEEIQNDIRDIKKKMDLN
ncbi:MAG: hypothetical protein HKO66_03045 [Saprospiraceae bacterium]|nr:hypothetical protein [Bacteroidia bacterium]NNL91191.1 hypothetical protein [Saprospiraceae bacterium]